MVLSDHDQLIYLIRKISFSSEKPKNLIYRYYSKFSPESFKNNLMLASPNSTNNLKFEICFVYLLNILNILNFWYILNKHVPKKTDLFRDSYKPWINNRLHKAIMKRSQLKNKANKTRANKDFINYKKECNFAVN